MKVIATAALSAFIVFGCQQAPEVNEIVPADHLDSNSYALGVQLGNTFRTQFVEVNAELIAAGIRDAIAEKPLITEDELRIAMQNLQVEASKKGETESVKQADSNKKVGKSFLEQNASKEGVKTTASGLQYKVIVEGSGAKPTPANTVRVHYTGTLLDGKVFDSSHQRKEPVEFPLGNVIPGWVEGLQLMSVGSKYMLYIPSQLAYGDGAGSGPIPAGSTLIFEVELLAITK